MAMSVRSADNRAMYSRVKPPILDESVSCKKEVPPWHKYALTIDEAARYFGIGENKFRVIISNNPDADYVLHKGAQILLKREMLEKYFNSIHSI